MLMIDVGVMEFSKRKDSEENIPELFASCLINVVYHLITSFNQF